MHNFFYHNPCRIIFGRGSSARLAEQARMLGSRALLVYGSRHLRESGRLPLFLSSLAASRIKVADYSGVPANPTFEEAAKGIRLCRKEECDLVIGIGGGSVMDTARAISAGFYFGEELRPVFYGKKRLKKRLPLILLPTLPGTGSATGHGMVLRDRQAGLKLGCGAAVLHADCAIIDSELMSGTPIESLTAAGIDAFCHAMELYANHSATATTLQKRLLVSLARSIVSGGINAAKGSPSEAYDELAWAGELLMNGIITAGTGWVSLPLHAIEHALSGSLGNSHGAGLAFLTRGWLRCGEIPLRSPAADFFAQVFSSADLETSLPGPSPVDYFDQWLNKMAWKEPGVFREINPAGSDEIVSRALKQAEIWQVHGLSEKRARAIIAAAIAAPCKANC